MGVLLAILLFSGDIPDCLKPLAPIRVAGAQRIAVAYGENEVAANKEYRGKPLVVIGKIDSIRQGIDKPYVTLHTNDPLGGVQLYFKNPDSQPLERLKKGDLLAVQGKCQGAMLGSVVIEECKTFKPEETRAINDWLLRPEEKTPAEAKTAQEAARKAAVLKRAQQKDQSRRRAASR